MSLVKKFQERLSISREMAIWRVIGFLFILACCVAVVVIAIADFPYAASFTEEVSLLPDNHVQVSKILDGEVLVGRDQFLQVAEGNTVFIALGEETITYMTKVAGVSYRYNKILTPVRHVYSVSQQIKNGMVVREMERNTGIMIMTYIVAPLFTLFILFILIIWTQTKRVSGWGWGESAVYREVWL